MVCGKNNHPVAKCTVAAVNAKFNQFAKATLRDTRVCRDLAIRMSESGGGCPATLM
jgi:hypothetical protein